MKTANTALSARSPRLGDLVLVPIETIQFCLGCGSSLWDLTQVDRSLDVCLSCNLRWALGIGDPAKLDALDQANEKWRRRIGAKSVLKPKTIYS